jgi:hypothetical protein
MGDYTRTERGSYHMWFAALVAEGRAYVGVGLSKWMLQYPRAASQVRERFPPLRERLASVSRQALFEELGKGYAAGRILTYPENRDAIILEEILSRGPLTDAEVRQAVIGTFDDRAFDSGEVINLRVIAFLRALQGPKQLAAYAPALESVLLGAPIHSATEDFVIGHVFASMERYKIDFSPAAFAFLERGRYTRQSLFYLSFNAQNEKTLHKLEGISVAPEFQTEKKSAIYRISNTLHAMTPRQ